MTWTPTNLDDNERIQLCGHRRRHGFEVGGTNSGAKRRNFFSVSPKLALCPPIPGAQPEHTMIPQWKTDIVKITQVKKQGTVDLATDNHGVLQNTPPEI